MNTIRQQNIASPHSKGKTGICRWQACLKGLMVCLLISLPWGICNAASERDTPVAKGKGIVLTKGDVDNFRIYTEKRKFSTSDEQLLKVLMRITLFATEAERLGLGGDRTFSNTEDGKLQKTIWLSEIYIEKLMNEYPVSDLVIESYYLSHPEKFPAKAGGTQSIGNEQKAEILKMVRQARRPEIAKNAFENLKREYNLQIVEGDNK